VESWVPSSPIRDRMRPNSAWSRRRRIACGTIRGTGSPRLTRQRYTDREGIVKSQVGLGSIAGLVVGLLSWRGNQSANLVSTFPDALTFVAMALLLVLTIRLVQRRMAPLDQTASMRAGVTVAAAAGVVFGAAVVGLGVARFANPAPLPLVFGFLTALGSALACGLVVAFVSTRSLRQGPA